jgi:hypothetical protein
LRVQVESFQYTTTQPQEQNHDRSCR